MTSPLDTSTHPLAGKHPPATQEAGWDADTGLKRASNEDRVAAVSLAQSAWAGKHAVGVYAVADGMGGHANGEVASDLAIRAATRQLVNLLTAADDTTPRQQWLLEAVNMANDAVRQRAKTDGTDMGTTLVLAMVSSDHATIANVGDSRAYHITLDTITQITKDHNAAQYMVDQGAMTEEQARQSKWRHTLQRSIGHDEDVEPDTYTVQLGPNDALLLCSDGLNSEVDDETIARFVREAATPQDACTALVDAANAAGGHDNIAVVVVRLAT